MNKKELFEKLNNLDPKLSKKIGLSLEENQYLKTLVLNDKLGLKLLNFKETKEDLSKTNYILFKDKELNNNINTLEREREREREREPFFLKS